jgi:RNA polymerase sigma-70 factor (ECF subfamily)
MENRAYRRKTDKELIEICETDREAFGELARRHRAIAFRAAVFVLRNPLDAEDQVQNALCKALEHIGDFENRAKFSTWLVRIVVNECLMQLRQARRAVIVSLDTDCGESPFIDERSPESPVEEVFLARLLEREIRHIPPLLRNAFLLRDVEERPIGEVATCLGITVGAAKSRLLRAREELRNRLTPHVLEHYKPSPPQVVSTETNLI